MDHTHTAGLHKCISRAKTKTEQEPVPAFLRTSLASMTVPTPTVKAIVGTLERSPSKNLALASIVSIAKVFTRVLDTKLDPGSLKAM